MLKSLSNSKHGINLINNEVIITEKLDTFRFLFKVSDDKNISFFKKDYTPINLVERIMNDIWEDAIRDISECVSRIDGIPSNYMFGVSYTPTFRPLRIPYPNLPKYILTDISIIGKRGKGVKDHNELCEWSSRFGIGKPPIIFNGVLDSHQKEILYAYDKRDFDKIKEFEFTKLINNILGESYSKNDIIEGIVIYDKNLSNPVQIESHEFNILNESYNKMHDNRTMYDMILLNLSKYLNEQYLSKDGGEMGYIDTVCNIFNDFITDLNNISFITEEAIRPTHYGYKGNVNLQLLNNKTTIDKINEHVNNGYVFNIILNAFRKHKRPTDILNENITTRINRFIDVLNEKYEINIINKINDVRQSGDISNMKMISSIHKAFDNNPIEVDKGVHNVILYISNFSPFSSSELNILETIHTQYNYDIILVHCNQTKIIDDKKRYLVSDNLVNAQMKSIVDNIPYIKDCVTIDEDNIVEIYNKIRPECEPYIIISSNNTASDYINQLYFYEHVCGGIIGVLGNLDIKNIDKEDNIILTQSIENEDTKTFCDNVPKFIQWVWDNIRIEYKIWCNLLK